ncbi:MAG: glycogen synthase [Candidatus Marinimicrobia bacterium]|nr:glycogen synthase [Candidatus Neomarinimicrobiota bacterium]MCF7851021.1 glycogen synthase [Candidatus Neomarinimicrobiota bacterium]
MNIVFAAAEVAPFSKAGGLADVAGSLPSALQRQGLSCQVISPLYGSVDRVHHRIEAADIKGKVLLGKKTVPYVIFHSKPSGEDETQYWFVSNPTLFDRDGIYTDATGEGYADNNQRFFFFQLVILDLISRKILSPDILHCNDHHTGLLPLLTKSLPQLRSVFTIHNFLYHGHFSDADKALLPEGIRNKLTPTQWDNYSALLEAITWSDAVNTVSPGYARELMAGENVDEHSLSIIRNRPDGILGILNGIDVNYWNPELDDLLPCNYSPTDRHGKKKNKRALLEKLELQADVDAPLFGSISRLVENKGFALIFESIEDFLADGAAFVFLGSGDPVIAMQLQDLLKKYPAQLAFYDGFNEKLAHLIEAGSDFFLMPSRVEPCGLNQLYSLQYGTIPIVNKTGGLGDSVEQWSAGQGTGFVFEPYLAIELRKSIELALKVFDDKEEWDRLISRAMEKDFSWAVSAKQYIELYTSWK